MSSTLTFRTPTSPLHLHHVLQEYRQTEREKGALEKKLLVLQQQCESNQKKAKNMQSCLMRIN